MPGIILAINAGSSSVKVSVFALDKSPSASSSDGPAQLAEIQIAGLTAPPAKLTYTRGSHKTKDQELSDVKSSDDAWKHIIDHLIDDTDLSEFSSPDDITFACHRVVHGGDNSKPLRIDANVLHQLEDLSDLAPLHNAGALEIVKAVQKRCPKATNVAFFDSAFHATLPPEVRTYAIDAERAKANKLRKYGFHGLSYAFITRAVAAHAGKEGPNLIALHLGSGCSAAAIKNGQSVDTTMGLTPLAGLPGATRSGDIDASLIFHFTHDAGKLSSKSSKELHITTAEEVLNQQSGWKALAGTTDFGEISAQAEQGDANAKLAFDLLIDRIVGYAASYYVKLGGEVDGLVFAGGIGEKGVQLRREVTKRLECLGFKLDAAKNEDLQDESVVDISAERARHKVLVVQTDEQAEMARQCAQEAESLRG